MDSIHPPAQETTLVRLVSVPHWKASRREVKLPGVQARAYLGDFVDEERD